VAIESGMARREVFGATGSTHVAKAIEAARRDSTAGRTIARVSTTPRRVIDVSAEAIAASDACCGRHRAGQARNFYYGMRLTPPDRRVHLYACYAWMRHADDCIDQARRRRRVASRSSNSRRSARCIVGSRESSDDTDFWPAFRSAIRTCSIEPRLILEMIEGMREDVDHQGTTRSTICFDIAIAWAARWGRCA
jgi:phytoene synthase